MLISLEWLKDYLRFDKSVEEIRDLLTFSGIEAESISSYGELTDTIVTVKITECKKMADSDHLQICKTDTGKEILQVVCGAPNCSPGAIGILALPGTRMGEVQIKQTRIRGIESSGMLCSEKELGLSDDHSGIIILPSETPIGIPAGQLLHLPDTVFTLEITPNRPDLLGYYGIATDLSASMDNSQLLPLAAKIGNLENTELMAGNFLNLENAAPQLCERYVARVIRDITVRESPLWLRLRLLKSGLRPINNIVDITNYIMLETGHPLHAFDYDKLQGRAAKPEIIVRTARPKELFSALDGNTYELNEENLVIADGKKPVALAGVIGGVNSHITEGTINIVLEAACFNHSSVRRTAWMHKIQTDSAYRFERHLAPETCELASCRAAEIILRLAGGKLCTGSLDDWQNKSKPRIIPLRPSRFEKITGLKLNKQQIPSYLTKLGLQYLGEGCYKKEYPQSSETIPRIVQDLDHTLYSEIANDVTDQLNVIDSIEEALYFQIPPKRIDLLREVDLVEELARLHGMDNVPQKTRASSIMDRHETLIQRKAADYLVHKGLQEIINLSLADPDLIGRLNLDSADKRLNQISLLNPQNVNLSVLRTSLIPQMLITALYNLNHGSRQIKIFELNKVFLENGAIPKQEPKRLSLLIMGNTTELNWKIKAAAFDFHDLKGLVEGFVYHLGIREFSYSTQTPPYLVRSESQSLICNEKHIAEYGRLDPAIASGFGIETAELKQNVWLADIDFAAITEITRSQVLKYEPMAKYPSVERDISFLIKSGVDHSMVFECIINTSPHTISDLTLTDEYRGKQIPQGFRSLTYRIVFNHPEKTLTDAEVDTIVESMIDILKLKWDIQLRS